METFLSIFLYHQPLSVLVTTLSVVGLLSMATQGLFEAGYKNMRGSKFWNVPSHKDTPPPPKGGSHVQPRRDAAPVHAGSSSHLGIPVRFGRQPWHQEPVIDLKRAKAVLFLVGISDNLCHHWLLAGLRKEEGEKEYTRGGLFGLVACPHYLFVDPPYIASSFGGAFKSTTSCPSPSLPPFPSHLPTIFFPTPPLLPPLRSIHLPPIPFLPRPMCLFVPFPASFCLATDDMSCFAL